jgi:hypothetical protein
MTDIFEYRIATNNDEAGILTVLTEVAPEIPVELDGPERQAKIWTEIVQCCKSGKSLVAVEADGKVVGFILARPDAYENKAAIQMPYGGVTAAFRCRKIFSALVEKLKANGVPLIAHVLHDNKSDMENTLMKRGFTEIDYNAKQKKYLWLPAAK